MINDDQIYRCHALYSCQPHRPLRMPIAVNSQLKADLSVCRTARLVRIYLLPFTTDYPKLNAYIQLYLHQCVHQFTVICITSPLHQCTTLPCSNYCLMSSGCAPTGRAAGRKARGWEFWRLPHLDQTSQDFIDRCHTICIDLWYLWICMAVFGCLWPCTTVLFLQTSHFVEYAITACGMTHYIGRKKRIAQFQSE